MTFPVFIDAKTYWDSTKITTARHLARIGNEKGKNIIVLENLHERHPLGKPELEGTEDKRV